MEKEEGKNSSLSDYKIVCEIGKGAFAKVVKAKHIKTGENYAIKIFPHSFLRNDRDKDLFQREVDATGLLKHDNIINMYDFFSDSENYYLVLDFCQHGDLMNYIDKNDKVPESTAALIFSQIVEAVNYCHSRGVAHRDLKPENILFDKFPHIKVTDFGMCGYIDNDTLMSTFCGSPCYSAPECLSQKAYDGKAADVWSLGVLLYFMVTGMHPWPTNNISQMMNNIVNCNYALPRNVSKEFNDLIKKILVANPNQRLTTQEILKHPWFNVAKQSKVQNRLPKKNSSLPPLPPNTQATKKIKDVARELHSSVTSPNLLHNGIFSPIQKITSATPPASPLTAPVFQKANTIIQRKRSSSLQLSPSNSLIFKRNRSKDPL